MSHTYCSSLFHCVFSTKERQRTIAPEIQERLWAYMGGIARENEMKALAVGGMEDHAHLLLSLPSTMTIAEAMRKIKGGSSLWMHERFPRVSPGAIFMFSLRENEGRAIPHFTKCAKDRVPEPGFSLVPLESVRQTVIQ